MDAWGIDVVLTASQKGLGTPPGLSILVASQKAVQVCLSPKPWRPATDAGTSRYSRTAQRRSQPTTAAGRSAHSLCFFLEIIPN